MTHAGWSRRRRLATVLSVVFLFAMFMGPGPGLRLVNPDWQDPNANFFLFGLPVIYVWGILCYVVQLTVVVIAYFTIWADDVRAEERSETESHAVR